MTSATLHAFGRQALLDAWPLVTGETPSLPELQIAGAVANFESVYGTATFRNALGSPVSNTNNWGAIQCGGSSPPCPAGCFEATDTSPAKVTADNPHGEYQACFRQFATPAEGATHFIRELTVRRPESWAAMKAGDIDTFSTEMHTRHGAIGAYYEGFGRTPEEQIANHALAVEHGVTEISSALSEPVSASRGGAKSLVPGMLVAATGSFLFSLLFRKLLT